MNNRYEFRIIKDNEAEQAVRIEQGMAYFDGDTRVPMKTGDRIVIKKARRDTLIVKISNISFLETLRKKMANI